MVDAAFADKARDTASWPVTDCDHLDRAFELLEARGVVARQHFRVATTAAWKSGVIARSAARRRIDSYAFYHAAGYRPRCRWAPPCALRRALGMGDAGSASDRRRLA